MKLTISKELELPKEAVTQTFAILAKRGSGKTYTGAVMAEEMLKAGLPTVIVDPVGVWWGLRAAANGKDEGLPIVVIGGEHGDLPLEEKAGEVIADLVVDQQRSVVLDLSLLRKGAQVRFMVPFLETLYRRNRSPLMLIMDEADAFAPQRPQKDEARVLGAMEDIVRRGRARGIGCTLITQRPAVLNKNVLTQIEVLVCLRMIAPQDRAAVEAWVEVHGTPGQCKELMDSLPSLKIGTAWFWSPGWLDLFRKVQVRLRETFDSSSTPEVGEKAIVPRKLKPIDLEDLRTKMAATIEEQKANDPRELKARIAELTRELAAAKAEKPKPEVVEVRVITPQQMERLEFITSDLRTFAQGFRDDFEKVAKAAAMKVASAGVANPHPSGKPVSATEFAGRLVKKLRFAAPSPPVADGKNGNEGKDGFGPRHQAILDALASFQGMGMEAVKKDQLAIFCEKSPSSSAWANDLGKLRSWGLIDYPAGGMVKLTTEGAGNARMADKFNTLEELHEAWYRKLEPRHASIVSELVPIYPEAMTKEELAAAVGKSATSSAFANDLGKLRSLGIIDYPRPGAVHATDLLFPPI
jgi:hypothetical protein